MKKIKLKFKFKKKETVPERKKASLKQKALKGKKPKRGKSFKFAKPGRPGRVLVFETTGTVLSGSLASCNPFSPPNVHPSVVSHEADFALAVGDVLAKLRSRHGKYLPKKAVLVTPSVTADMLSLPVNPKKPRPRSEMMEVVRWEMEEAFMRLGDIWSLGGLLQSKGYLTADLRRELETREVPGGGHRTALAVYGEAVSRDNLNECLNIQEVLAGMDDDLFSGWTPGEAGDDAGTFAWYAAGMGDGLRTKWAAAFKANGLFLSWIYPRLGASLPLVNPASGGWLLVDVCQEQYGLFKGGASGRTAALAGGICDYGSLDPHDLARAVSRFSSPEIRQVRVSAPKKDMAGYVAGLKTQLGQDIEILPVDPAAGGPEPAADEELTLKEPLKEQDRGAMEPEPPEMEEDPPDSIPGAPPSAALQGAAIHALGRCPKERLVRIQARDPKPPVWKNMDYWPWAAIVIVAVGIAGFDTYIRDKAAKTSWELELLDIEYNRRLKMKNEVQKTNAEAGRLNGVLKAKEAELAEIKRLKNILDNVIRYRQDFVPGILETVGGAVTDGVVLDRVEEDRNHKGFYLEGWAVRDTEGQRFGNRLNKALAPLGYKVGALTLSRGSNRHGMEGYHLKIRLVKDTDKEEKHA